MVLYSIVSGVAMYYVTFGWGFSSLFTKDRLGDKTNEEIRAMKDWKDTSRKKKALYVLFPGIYTAIKSEKRKRDRLEMEFEKRYDIEIPKEPIDRETA